MNTPCGTICLIVSLAFLTVAAPQLTDRGYELKGETPGITTLKEFKKNHQHPDCEVRTARQTSCRVYEGVSFAGARALVFKGCMDRQCGTQGIFAEFFDGVLVKLTYGVMETDDVVPLLKAKYGDPTCEGETCSWHNSIGSLTVFHSQSTLTTTVTSELHDKGAKSDI
jgi:hypothetical protein